MIESKQQIECFIMYYHEKKRLKRFTNASKLCLDIVVLVSTSTAHGFCVIVASNIGYAEDALFYKEIKFPAFHAYNKTEHAFSTYANLKTNLDNIFKYVYTFGLYHYYIFYQ